jgi:threonylcarbamoyladenosine tRNA methylthiotransferase MtaB
LHRPLPSRLAKIKKIEEIVKEINNYPEKISEVILTAINTEAFGLDTGESFIDLIEKVLEKTSIPRLSFGSIHPWSITPQFINFYQKILTTNRFVKFFHIPLQSGSNTILKLMKRGYTREEILEKLHALQKINPLSLLATDVIVGFLGETKTEFEETYRFLEKSPLVKFHIFRFSKRKNTAAFYMAKNLKEPGEEEKKKRAKALAELFAKKYQQFLEKNLGRLSTALILKKQENSFYEALLDNQLPILIEKNKDIIPGEIVKVKVERIKNGKLVGKIN